VLPSSDDPVVAGAVRAIGGPPGRHARIGAERVWSVTRVLLALTLLTSVFGFFLKAPCRDGSTWQNEHQYLRGCYTDVVALYSAEGLSQGKTPYYDHPVEYPVVIGGVMELTARATDALTPDGGVSGGMRFYDLTWVLLTIGALIGVVTTARLSGRRPWDAAMFALAPGLLFHATTNWDLVAIALAGLALLAWARQRPVAAGILLGFATATKLYPVLFLIPLLLLCWRAAKVRQGLVTAAMTVLAAVAVTLPVYLTAPSFAQVSGQQVRVLDSPLDRLADEGFSALKPQQMVGNVEASNAVYRFFELNTTRGADWDSLYLQVQRLQTEDGPLKGVRNALASAVSDPAGTPERLNRLVAVLEIFLVGFLVVLTFAAPRRPRLPQLLFLMTAGFLLVNKVNSPQYVLWLIPLAVLARPRWRPFLAWQAAEVAVLWSRFYFFVANDKPGEGIDIGWFFAAVLLRDALLLGYMGLVVRDVLHPERDVVRADGVDDPAGGVLDGAPDRRAVLA
jgi:uncharacterized membrane protein